MANDSLRVPPKVEYVIVKERHYWNKWTYVLVLVLSAAILTSTLLWRSKEPVAHTYPEHPLEALGLKTSLRAKWLDGALHYRFTLMPLPLQEERFRSVLQKYTVKELKFRVRLVDKDGFQLCVTDPVLRRHLGSDGKPDALESEQAFENCTKSQYEAATQFKVYGSYPAIADSLDRPKPAQNLTSLPVSMLTGRDFTTGVIETLDNGSFRVTKQAEYMTLLRWQPADQISIACTGKLCVLTDTRTQESVHGTPR